LHIYGSKRVGTNNVDSLTTIGFESPGFLDDHSEEFIFGYDIPIGGGGGCSSHCKRNYRRELGNKQYEVTNHLGNVLATVSDRRLAEDNYSYTPSGSGDYSYDAIRNIYYAVIAGTGTHNRVTATSDNRVDWYTADVISYSDYYAFGAQMEGRNGGVYRYNFNGKETDIESDLQDYGMRIYNARLGKFLSVDPDAGKYAFMTAYCFAADNPVKLIDVNGKGPDNPPTPGSVSFFDYRPQLFQSFRGYVTNPNYGAMSHSLGSALPSYSVERQMLDFYNLPSGGSLSVTYMGSSDIDFNNDMYSYSFTMNGQNHLATWTRGDYESGVEYREAVRQQYRRRNELKS
jgi:RHS repeat-associated protein